MPYLVADPQPSHDVDYYEVEIDGEIVRSDPERDEFQVRLHHDLKGIAGGYHKVRVRAVNRWAESDWSPFLEFSSDPPPEVKGVTIESSYEKTGTPA